MRLAKWKSVKGVTSQNVTVRPDFDFAMSDSAQPEQVIEDGSVADARPACVALVPVTQRTEWTGHQQPSRPASTFIAQLLATAEQASQSRGLRRGTAADARTAYSVNQTRAAGIRTRHII
jgi:hypothetical protein